jgi:signal transduction histidine kinase
LYDSPLTITILVTCEVIIISVVLIIQGKRLFKLENKLKLAASRLEKNNQQLSKINHDLDNFVYAASHDLKAPISNIEALITALFEEIPENTKKNKDLLTIKTMLIDSVEKFRTTILDLTTIAKAQVAESYTETISIKDVVDEVKANLGKLIEENRPTFLEDYSKAPSIKFSKKNLRSILQNLISNAIKYKSLDNIPVVLISTERRNDFFILKVQDNGLGIKEEDKNKVFAMYNRLHSHVEGTGIGMTIVARIVDNNGGRVTIDSEVGKGTTFTVYLKEQTIEETL